jgi:hypothetical protein
MKAQSLVRHVPDGLGACIYVDVVHSPYYKTACRSLLDSGSAASVIKLKCIPTDQYFERPEGLQVTDIGGNPINIVGETQLYIELCGFKGIHRFLICEDSLEFGGSILLGLDFLIEKKVQVRFDKAEFVINRKVNKITYYNMENKTYVIQMLRQSIHNYMGKVNNITKVRSVKHTVTCENIGSDIESDLPRKVEEQARKGKSISESARQESPCASPYGRAQSPDRAENQYGDGAQLASGNDSAREFTIQIDRKIEIPTYVENEDSQCASGIRNVIEPDIPESHEILEQKRKTDLVREDYNCKGGARGDIPYTHREIELIQEMDLDHLSPFIRSRLEGLILHFQFVFSLRGEPIGRTTVEKHEIKTITDSPVYDRQYAIPYALQKIVQEKINELLEIKAIEPATEQGNGYNSPILLSRKSKTKNMTESESYRFLTDFRLLNSVTKLETYPIPNLQCSIDSLSKKVYFTVMDLCQGFRQIVLTEDSRDKTSFTANKQRYRYVTLPMGLTASPFTLCKLMQQVFGDITNGNVVCYMDDIIVATVTLEEHLREIEEVFCRLRKANLTLKPSKCSFMKEEADFVGFHVTHNEYTVNDKNVEKVRTFPRPTSPKGIRSFHGLCNFFRRHIKDYSKYSSTLLELTKKGVKFNWSEEHERCFLHLKEALITKPVLAQPDMDKPFIVYTDGSYSGLGALLTQEYPDGEKAIAYASKSLDKTAKAWTVSELELAAVLLALSSFHVYLWGKRFILYSDHKALVWLAKMKDPTSRLLRWALKIQDYVFEIRFKSGKNMLHVDALSRMTSEELFRKAKSDPVELDQLLEARYEENIGKGMTLGAYSNPCNDPRFVKARAIINGAMTPEDPYAEEVSTWKQSKDVGRTDFSESSKIVIRKLRCEIMPIWDHEYIHTKQRQDSKLLSIITNLMDGLPVGSDYQLDEEGILYKSVMNPLPRIVMVAPKTMIKYIFDSCHNNILSAHPGYERTLNLVKENFYFPNMSREIQRMCKSCVSCAEYKTSPHLAKAPLGRFMQKARPWQLISGDVVGPLVTTPSGNKYLVTFYDSFTRWGVAVPAPDQRASTLARIFVEHIILPFGCPECYLTDRASAYMGELTKEVCRLLGVKKCFTSSYHAMSSLVERIHRTMATALSHYVNQQQDDWDINIPYIMTAYNATPQTSTKFSPYELLYGHKYAFPFNSIVRKGLEKHYNYDDYSLEFCKRMQMAYDLVRANTEKSREKYVKQYDKKAKPVKLEVGDIVLLRNTVVKPGLKKKFTKKWIGFYKIIREVSRVNFVIRPVKGGKHQIVHANRLKIFEGLISDKYGEAGSDDSGSEEEITMKDDVEPDIWVEDFPLPSTSGLGGRMSDCSEDGGNNINALPSMTANGEICDVTFEDDGVQKPDIFCCNMSADGSLEWDSYLPRVDEEATDRVETHSEIVGEEEVETINLEESNSESSEEIIEQQVVGEANAIMHQAEEEDANTGHTYNLRSRGECSDHVWVLPKAI